MNRTTLALALLTLCACADAALHPLPPVQVDAGTPDAPELPPTAAGDECATSYDCLLDTVCRDGSCVRVECVPGVRGLCDPGAGDLCAREGLEWREDAPHVCTQWLGCPGDPWSVCEVARPYCDPAAQPVPGWHVECPDPGTRWWASVSDVWDCREMDAPCD